MKNIHIASDAGHEACLINACRAFGAGCRFSVFEPDLSEKRAARAAAATNIARGRTGIPDENETAAEPLVTATYEAGEDNADEHPLAGEAAYLRRGGGPALGGPTMADAPLSGAASDASSRDGARGGALLAQLRQAVETSGWPRFLHEHTGGVVRRHEAFSISLAGCGNACSNPHIADVGFVAVWRPETDKNRCAGSQACAGKDGATPCVSACPEGLVTLFKGKPVIDRKTCLDCGRCVKACPALALSGPRGWRIYLGGCLGRRPRLALPLPGVFPDSALPALLVGGLKLHMEYYRPNARFSDTVLAHKNRFGKLLAEREHF